MLHILLRQGLRSGWFAVALIVPQLATVAAADEVPSFPAAAIAFFETDVRPLLAKHCFECHSGQGNKSKGGLTLDSRANILAGGDSGAAVVPGKPQASLLLHALRYQDLEMPPRGQLTAKEIAVFERWIQSGAPFPLSSETETDVQRRRGTFVITDADRSHWAYQPFEKPPLPPYSSAGATQHPVDLFIHQRLHAEHLQPNERAPRRVLIRRAFFDLLGMPPSPEDVARFVDDPSPTAWEDLIDSLLANPAYGERWGRHWLDVVRFAQSNGYERDDEKPFVWRYRDYVIASFNEDKPYDRFVVEQLAGDELTQPTAAALTATGFYRLGVWDDEPDDARAAEFDALDDMISTIGQVFLGQTVGCARCHHHMFDPIPQEDYYRMLAYLRNVKPYVRATDKSAPDTIFTDLPNGVRALTVRERGPEAPKTHVLIRGNAATPGKEVQPGVFQVLGGTAAETAAPQTESDRMTCGRRTALAQWITNPTNPLTARVIVNRVWQHHFGRGIVATANDFGRAGAAPSHPELLDWLACELIASGWSIKHLQRAIMQSRTYQASSQQNNVVARQGDSDNRWLWRQPLRRLDAEAIRDSILTVSGQINREMAGRGVFPRLSGELVAGQSKPGRGWEISPASQRLRRSTYIYVKRGLRDPLMEAFDYVNTSASLARRPTTTVAPQALMLLNSRFVTEQSAALARRLVDEVGTDHKAQVHRLFMLALARPPNPQELTTALAYLTSQQQQARALDGQITFQPEVPESLFQDYRRSLTPHDYFRGPRDAWFYTTGQWGGGYEGIDVIDRSQLPTAFWQGPQLLDCEIRGRLQLHAGCESAVLLVRATPRGGGWTGLACEIDPRRECIRLISQQDGRQVLAETPYAVATQRWHGFRIDVRGQRIRLWLNDDPQPVVDHHSPTPLPAGQLGVSAWGAPLTFDDLRVTTSKDSWDVAHFVPEIAHSTAPPAGWSQFGGRWMQSPTGVLRVQQDRGAKMTWDTQMVGDGEISVELRMTPGRAEIGGLIARVRDPKTGADNWHGYELSLNAAQQTVFIGDHRNNWNLRAQSPVKVTPGQWHKLRVVMQGPLLEIFVDDAREPNVTYRDPTPLPAGVVGLRTWGSEIEYRNLSIKTAERTVKAHFQPAIRKPQPVPDVETFARRHALEAFCRVIFNLNEFIYVD